MREPTHCIAALLIVVTTAGLALAEDNPSSQPQPPSPQRPGQAATTPPLFDDLQRLREDIGDLRKEIAEQKNSLIKDQIKELDSRLNFYIQIFLWIIGFFGLVIAVFGAAPVFAAMRSSIVADRRAAESHELAIRGERSAQTRSAEVHQTFLEGSKQTLDLVNATLTLAKEASERAANIIQRRANDLLANLDSKSKAMLADVAYKDDRALVADPENRSNLASLASRINGFEINRFIFPVDVPLTPSCQFIRGMDFHLKQQFNDAFEAWETVAQSEGAPDQLRSLAWYWIGYENNNLGYYPKAEDSFLHAENYDRSARKYELQRIRLETRFFNTANGLADRSIGPFENLLASMKPHETDNKVMEQRDKVLITYGNVLFQAAREAKNAKERADYFAKARTVFERIAEKEKWASFALGQILYYTGELEKAEGRLVIARRHAQEEDVNRIEPRTKVRARTTELICCVFVREFQKDAAAVYGNLVDALGVVEGRLTVYSQFQKRNVMKPEFNKDIIELRNDTKIGSVTLF